MREADTLGERIYARLKAEVTGGLVSVHVRLDFAELGARYGVSTTPVREAAMRLFGEGLLNIHPKGGLRPVPLREADLVALLDLHERLSILALRWPGRTRIETAGGEDASVSNRTRWFFAAIALATGNGEFIRVMAGLEDRLQRFRRLDDRLLPDVEDEFAALSDAAASPSRLARALRRYHRRRRAVAGRSILLVVDDEGRTVS